MKRVSFFVFYYLWAIASCAAGPAQEACLACQSNKLEKLKVVLKDHEYLKTKPLDTGKHDLYLIHVAANSGHWAILKYLIDEGGNINQQSRAGYTPLMLLIIGNHIESAKKLIETYNPNLDIFSRHGTNALYLAIEYQHTDLAIFLIDKGCFVNTTNACFDVDSPLSLAFKLKNEKVIDRLNER